MSISYLRLGLTIARLVTESAQDLDCDFLSARWDSGVTMTYDEGRLRIALPDAGVYDATIEDLEERVRALEAEGA